jgi:hypothetical protein
MLRFFKIIIIFILLLSFNFFNTPAQEVIYNLQQPDKDTIFFGMCFVGDSLSTQFILKNNGSVNLLMKVANLPWLSIGYLPPHADEFREFQHVSPKFPITIAPSDSIYFVIKYSADKDTIGYPIGIKMAELKLGLTQPDDDDNPVASRTFTLVAKKTDNYLDSYLNNLYFDSVYVNSSAEREWTIQNSSSYTLSIESQTFITLSPVIDSSEFKVSEFGSVIFQKKWDKVNWLINYSPRNPGRDSAFLRLKYKPKPIEIPDSNAFPFVKIFGTGVEQIIRLDTLSYKNCRVYGDTIDFGDVRIGDTLEAIFKINNIGNIPLGCQNQNIIQENSDEISKIFTISKKLLPDGKYLFPNKSDSVIIKFFPDKRERVVNRYVIRTDIDKRKIYGYPKDSKELIFYVKGRGIEPVLSVGSNTIDFGTFITGCPQLDTLFPIANLGNSELIIKSISIDPPPPVTPFEVTPVELKIPADSTKINKENIKVSFFTRSTDIEFIHTLILVTNARKPNDTIKIILKAAAGRPTAANLKIPDEIRAKPGRIVNIPIIIDSGRVTFARTFNDTLTFNKTILRYEGYYTVGTASEVVPYNYINVGTDNSEERIFISLKTPGDSYFLPRDTLILIAFRTYLGDRASTQIAFQSPKFSDGVCDRVLSLTNIKNGIFSLDSVCGLNLKTIPIISEKFSLNEIYPNPAQDIIKIGFETAFTSVVEFNLYNSFGEKIENINNRKFPAGNYELLYNCSNLLPGIYAIEMKSGIFRQVRMITITR